MDAQYQKALFLGKYVGTYIVPNLLSVVAKTSFRERKKMDTANVMVAKRSAASRAVK